MNEQVKEFRSQVRENPREGLIKATTKARLVEIAEQVGIENPAGTKDELFDMIVPHLNLPDQSLRGTSSIESPVAFVWEFTDALFLTARKKEQDPPRRKDVVAALKEQGVAHHTARTQYQRWFEHTNRGTKLMADGNHDGLPRKVAEHLGLVEPAEAAA